MGDIMKVITAAEADELWELPSGTLKLACNLKKLEAGTYRKSSHTWLIEVESVIKKFGLPKQELRL